MSVNSNNRILLRGDGLLFARAMISVVIAGLLLTGLSACNRSVPRVEGQDDDSGAWLSHGRTPDEQRFSPLVQISTTTVARLGLAWIAQLDTDRGQVGTPLVAGGVIYISTAWSKVAAFDAESGSVKWQYDPQVAGQKAVDACCDVVNRGIALWQDRIFVGTLDGRLVALDRHTGKPLWSVQTTPTDQPYSITGAPCVANGLVIIGNAGSDYGVRGFLSAYNVATGSLVWRFYVVPSRDGAPDHAASDSIMKRLVEPTWHDGAWQEGGAGGSPWDGITYDPVTDLIIFGTGNATPWNDRIRSERQGDNLLTTSIVALHAKTGQYAWHYQTTPRDAWDYDATQQLVNADLSIGGEIRHVVMQANKNGFYYVLDALTGKLISAHNFVPVTWASGVDLQSGRPVETPEARYTEHKGAVRLSPAFAHVWQPMSFDKSTGLMYLPATINSRPFGDVKSYQYVAGRKNLGVSIGIAAPAPAGATDPKAAPGVPAVSELLAWDPLAGAARWRVPTASWPGGVLATAGGLVFQASGHDFKAYDSASGKAVWRFDLGQGAVAPPITFIRNGTQYVALLAGYGGSGGFSGTEPRRPGRLMVFKLDGKARVPPFPEAVQMPLLDLSAAEASTGNANRGADHYNNLCVYCHMGGIYLPNLARSPMILSRDAFSSIVLGGALASRGMASFQRFLEPKDAEDLRSFLLWRAKTGDFVSLVPGDAPASGGT